MSLFDESSSPRASRESVSGPGLAESASASRANTTPAAASGAHGMGSVAQLAAAGSLPVIGADEPRIDLPAVRRMLDANGGKDYWRSLEQLSETPGFRDFLEREFPRHAAVWDESFDRRKFLGLMGASLALAGASGCLHQPEEKIVPYVRQPEGITQGESLHFATAMPQNGYAEPLLVTSRMGRPIKVEGNPEHPASRGATNIFSQASILDMYDPDRSKTPLFRGSIETWGHFVESIESTLPKLRESKGAGLQILTETITSPSIAAQIEGLLRDFPEAKWRAYQPLHRASARAGAKAAFGEELAPVYKFDKAEVILALDCDFLGDLPGSVRYASDFADARRVCDNPKSMSRLYVIESTPSLAGAKADHRWRVASSKIESILRALAGKLGVDVARSGPSAEVLDSKEFSVLVDELNAHMGKCLVVVGDGQPAAAHALTHAINHALGNAGATVDYVESVEATVGGGPGTLSDLATDLRQGKVETLLILGGNPVHFAPADIEFKAALEKALGLGEEKGNGSLKLCIRLGEYYDETSLLSHWHVPAAHYLESWSDARAYDGTPTIIQPLISPLYGGKTVQQVLGVFEGRSGLSAYELVQSYWQTRLGGESKTSDDVNKAWRKFIHDGLLADAKSPVKNGELKFDDKPTRATPAVLPRKSPGADRARRSKSSSRPIPASAMAAMRTMSGSKSSPSRSPKSCGTMWPW